MKLIWTSRLMTVCVVLSAAATALAFAAGQYILFAVLVLLIGVLWMLDRAQRFKHLASVMLVIFTLLAVFAFWLQLFMPLLVLAVSAALMAWDLDHFRWRIHHGPPVDNLVRLERHHIQQLLLVGGVGVLTAEATLLVQIQLSFWAAFGAALLVLFGLIRALALIRRSV
jgi:hypothetical protein